MKKILVIGITALVIVGCILAAGCTSADNTDVIDVTKLSGDNQQNLYQHTLEISGIIDENTHVNLCLTLINTDFKLSDTITKACDKYETFGDLGDLFLYNRALTDSYCLTIPATGIVKTNNGCYNVAKIEIGRSGPNDPTGVYVYYNSGNGLDSLLISKGNMVNKVTSTLKLL